MTVLTENTTNSQTATTPAMKTPTKSANPRSAMAGGTPRTPSGTAVMPISALNPYQNRVTIRGRVISKGDIRTWSKASGQGKLFSFELCDESGEIRATAFNEQVDAFYEKVQPKQVCRLLFILGSCCYNNCTFDFCYRCTSFRASNVKLQTKRSVQTTTNMKSLSGSSPRWNFAQTNAMMCLKSAMLLWKSPTSKSVPRTSWSVSLIW